MLDRDTYQLKLETSLRRAPITALLGPRQCGKTTLARMFASSRSAEYFDLESIPDQRRLQNPELVLGEIKKGLVVLDEIQLMPSLFAVLRVLADRPGARTRFLVLGSASPEIVRGASESLAGRVSFVEMTGIDIREIGKLRWERLWSRGGFPRALLARSDSDSYAWREDFVRTFLQRDIPQLGITIAAPAMRRFWTMLAHYHGQIWNASEIGRSMSLSDKTVRSYLDLLTGTYMIRQLQPWYENLAKRQVKSPKIYLRDTGILHRLLDLPTRDKLLSHTKAGASFEGFVIEQLLAVLAPQEAYFWSTHGGVELDLFLMRNGRRHGIEVKYSEAPALTASMRQSMLDLKLDKLWVLYPGNNAFAMDKNVLAWPVSQLSELSDALD